MKTTIAISLSLLFSIIISSCNIISNEQTKNSMQPSNKDSQENKADTFENDYFIILAYGKDTIQTLSPKEYEEVLKNDLTEISENKSMSPDTLYNLKAYNTLNYGSEQGQDLFYLIYAKYLSENANKDIPLNVKEELEELLYSLNIFMNENINLGTGFFHLYQRIPAYVQYELLNYNTEEDKKKPNKSEKNAFLALLKKQVVDKENRIMKWALEDFDQIINSEYKLTKAKTFFENSYGHLL